jgi:hypothetical protein
MDASLRATARAWPYGPRVGPVVDRKIVSSPTRAGQIARERRGGTDLPRALYFETCFLLVASRHPVDNGKKSLCHEPTQEAGMHPTRIRKT